MLGGALGYWWLPVSSLPQVDFPTIQVTTQLPGANPDTMANLVTAPLERQFGQIPALATMTSSSSYGISQITLQFDLNRDIDAAAQDVQAAINAAGSTLPRNLPYPADLCQGEPGRRADRDAGADLAHHLAAPAHRSRRHADGAAPELGAGVGPRLRRGRHPAGGAHPGRSRRGSPPTASAWRTCARPSSPPTSPAPRARSTAPHQSYTIAANDQIASAEAYKTVIVAYRNNAPVLLKDVAEVVDGLENTKVGGWYQDTPGRRHRRASPARRQRHRDGQAHQGRAAAPAARHAERRQAHRGARPHRHHPRLRPRRAVHAGAERGPGRAGGAAVPAHHPRHHHRRRGAAAVADRHLRRDVVLRLLASTTCR